MKRVVFRPKNTFLLASIGIAWSFFLGCYGVAFENRSSRYLTILSALGICVLSYLFFVRPKLELNAHGVTIINPLRIVNLEWGEIVDIEVRYSLYFITEAGKFNSWAAPVGGAPRFGSSGIRRTTHRDIHRSALNGTGFEGVDSIASAYSPDTDSGAALITALRYLDEFRRNALK